MFLTATFLSTTAFTTLAVSLILIQQCLMSSIVNRLKMSLLSQRIVKFLLKLFFVIVPSLNFSLLKQKVNSVLLTTRHQAQSAMLN